MGKVFSNLPLDKRNEITVATIEVQITYPDGAPVANANYELQWAGGGVSGKRTDANGKLKEDVPPDAKVTLKLPGIPLLAKAE
jgi:hypothetical protein